MNLTPFFRMYYYTLDFFSYGQSRNAKVTLLLLLYLNHIRNDLVIPSPLPIHTFNLRFFFRPRIDV